MLTPAEELGLSGMNLAARVRKAFYQLDAKAVRELMAQIRQETTRRHVVYLRDGAVETVRLLACPITVLPDQIAYLHYVTLTIHNALKRLPDLYIQDFAVRNVLKLTPPEEQWLWDCWGPSHQESNPIFGRLDAVVDFHSAMWKDSLKFVEPNMTGIGGLHLVPTCESVMAELVLPLLGQFDSRLQLTIGQDIRELLMQELLDHLEAMGRPPINLCFVEPKYATSGIDEQEDVAAYFQTRHGLRVMHADPSELTLDDGAVFYNGERVEMAYRDYSVLDLMTLERQGVDVSPMKTLFRENRVISSIAGELDQKSCWEVLTDPQFTTKYFSPEERQVFRRHVLWTRIVSPRNTLLPDGEKGDLPEYIRHERESLVLKPNRAYGGEGVQLGMAMTQAEWEASLERALADPERWVVQQRAVIPVTEFPVLGEDESVHNEPFYAVMGFAPSKYGVAVLGRASQKHVVNIAQRGGMCVVAIGHAPMRLLGPA